MSDQQYAPTEGGGAEAEALPLGDLTPDSNIMTVPSSPQFVTIGGAHGEVAELPSRLESVYLDDNEDKDQSIADLRSTWRLKL